MKEFLLAILLLVLIAGGLATLVVYVNRADELRKEENNKAYSECVANAERWNSVTIENIEWCVKHFSPTL